MDTINEYARDEIQMKFFHVCIKGLYGVTIYIDGQDYIAATNYTALAQYKSSIRVLAFCHMPNHSHFVIRADNQEQVESFLLTFKRTYSMYFENRHKEQKFFRRQDSMVKAIHDIRYLRQCIAYVLRNPLVAGLVKYADGYPWSSQSCYFSTSIKTDNYIPLSSLPARKIKARLKTHHKLNDSRFCIDSQWMIIPQSFVDYKTVEAVFNDSPSLFLKYVGWQDDNKIEYELMIKGAYRYDDMEMKSIADNLSKDKYGTSCVQLLPEQKRQLAFMLYKRYRTSPAQLSRILRIGKEMLQ